MKNIALQSYEQGLETENQVVDVIKRLNERWEHRFTLDNPRLVENYLEGKFHFLVLIEETGKPGTQFVALFERAFSKFTLGNDVELKTTKPEVDIRRNLEPLFLHHASEDCALEEPRRDNVLNLGPRSYQEAVLVDVVKLIESPETVIPSLVRFGSVDSIYGGLRHALYFSFTRGFVFRGAVGVDYGEADLLPLGLVEDNALLSAANLHEKPSEVIKGTSHLLESFPCDQRNPSDHGLGTRDIMLSESCVGKLRIWTDTNSIRLTVEEGFDSLFQILDVLVGPCDFHADNRDSEIGG